MMTPKAESIVSVGNDRETVKWQRSQGFTIFMKNCTDSVRCPLCGAHINERIGEVWHFCPGCGAAMED